MSGLERFQKVGIDQHISGETEEGELQTVKKTLFGRPFKGTDEIKTNLKFTESFRQALVKEYGERVTQWAFPTSSYDDRMLKAKPLSGYRIQQIIARAQEAKAKDDTALARLVSERAPLLLEKSLKEAGIELPEKDGEDWQRLVTTVEDEIRNSSKFQNSRELETFSFNDEFKGVVDKFVQDLKEVPNPDEPAPEVNDGPEMTLESEGSSQPLPLTYKEKNQVLKLHGLDDDKGSSFNMSKFGITTGDKVGAGGFGEVFPGTYEDPETKEVKDVIVKQMPPVQMSRERGGLNEAMAMYLVSNKHENYSQKVHIVPPSHYMISVVKDDGERQEDQLVKPGQLREILKDPKSIVVCQGLLMEEAPGDEVKKLMSGGQLTEEWEKKQFIKGTLESIKGLNERGFVHHDLKPANIFFDKNVDTKSGTTTLIDTGMLFKTPKDMETEKHPQYIGGHGGTDLYMHPRALSGQKHGTETDLYAVGVLALEVDHPKAFGHLQAAMKRQNLEPEGITREWLLDQLNAEITKLNPNNTIPENEKSPLLKDLEALHKELKDPNSLSLSSFAMDCFAAAGQPAIDWHDRETSQKWYSELLDHQVFK